MKKILLLLLLTICFTVSKAQVPTPNPANGQNYCIGTQVVYGPQNITPGETYTYSITPTVPFTTISNGNQIQVTWGTAGTYTLEITTTNAAGCSSTATATINVNPVNTATGAQSLCEGTSTTLINPGLPAGGTWSGVGVTGNTFNATGLTPGTYTATYSGNDPNGCPFVGTVTVTVEPIPPAPVIYSNQ